MARIRSNSGSFLILNTFAAVFVSSINVVLSPVPILYELPELFGLTTKAALTKASTTSDIKMKSLEVFCPDNLGYSPIFANLTKFGTSRALSSSGP